jgi:hypothetical protein
MCMLFEEKFKSAICWHSSEWEVLVWALDFPNAVVDNDLNVHLINNLFIIRQLSIITTSGHRTAQHTQ